MGKCDIVKKYYFFGKIANFSLDNFSILLYNNYMHYVFIYGACSTFFWTVFPRRDAFNI